MVERGVQAFFSFSFWVSTKVEAEEVGGLKISCCCIKENMKKKKNQTSKSKETRVDRSDLKSKKASWFSMSLLFKGQQIYISGGGSGASRRRKKRS